MDYWVLSPRSSRHFYEEINTNAMQILRALEDNTEAVKWFRVATEQVDTDAQYNLGIMYHLGNGVLQDNVTAHIMKSVLIFQDLILGVGPST